MSFQVNLFFTIILMLLSSVNLYASQSCFDGDASKIDLLHKELPTENTTKNIGISLKIKENRSTDFFDTGKIADPAKGDDVHFGSLLGTVKLPLSSIVSALKDHNTTKSPSVAKLTVTVDKAENANAPETHRVHFEVHPFLFVTVEWTERWIYTPGAKSTLISYDKIEGTSHIKHMCGQIFVRETAPLESSVYLYEEVQATRRSPENTLEGIFGTLKTLRQKESKS